MTGTGRRRHSGGIPAQQVIVTGLLRWLAEFQSQGPWSARRLVAEPREDGSIAFEFVEAVESGEYRTKGAFTAVEGQQFVALQRVMASRNGTWRRVELVVTSQGSGDARFDYGDDQAGREDEVDATGPPPLAP